jgi:hypothetical protein
VVDVAFDEIGGDAEVVVLETADELEADVEFEVLDLFDLFVLLAFFSSHFF